MYPASRTTRVTSEANDSLNAKRHSAPLLAGCFFPPWNWIFNDPCAQAKQWTFFQGQCFLQREVDLLFHKNNNNNHRLPSTLLLLLLLFFFFVLVA